MLKRTKVKVGVIVVAIVIGGIVWFNIDSAWTYLFTEVSEAMSQTNSTDQDINGTVADANVADRAYEAVSIQAMFRLVYVVLGAGLTVLALFVGLVDFVLHRRQGKSFFTVGTIHSRQQYPGHR